MVTVEGPLAVMDVLDSWTPTCRRVKNLRHRPGGFIT